jgi:hypothetical protein
MITPEVDKRYFRYDWETFQTLFIDICEVTDNHIVYTVVGYSDKHMVMKKNDFEGFEEYKKPYIREYR